jgi:ribosomal protein L11 methyltransferase
MSAHTPVLQRTYAVEPKASEEFAALLWRAGSLGSHQAAAVDGAEIHRAYFALGAAAPVLPPGVALVTEETVGPADWMAAWRAQAEPLAIGRRLLIDPREPGVAPALSGRREAEDAPASHSRRILLRIPARSAFGTGGHESTRLVLELLERLPLAGARVLDVGTGAGLLTLAALALGAATAVGFDVDLVAPILARHNALLNRSAAGAGRAHFFAGTAAALGDRARCDLLLVNVIPEEIRSDLRRLSELLRPGGAAVFSGILASESRAALVRLREHGFARVGTRRAGDWVAYLCRRS